MTFRAELTTLAARFETQAREAVLASDDVTADALFRVAVAAADLHDALAAADDVARWALVGEVA